MGEEAAVREGLHRRIALVTGASSGLGRATALALAGAGADVAALARSEPDLERLVEEISALGRKALALPIDLARPEDALSAVERAAEALGAIDILVNSAATDVPGRVADISVESWDRVIGVNLRAPFVLAKAVLPHMQKAGAGTIINVSSVAGKRGWAGAAAYCASKFGLTGLTQALAAEGTAFGSAPSTPGEWRRVGAPGRPKIGPSRDGTRRQRERSLQRTSRASSSGSQPRRPSSCSTRLS